MPAVLQYVTSEVWEISAIHRAKSLILVRYSEHLSLGDIVAGSGLLRYCFLRLFKRETGLSPPEFLIRCRIDRAKECLSYRKPLIEITIETAFFDQSLFCHHFKRVTGQSPSSYGKRE